MATEYPRQHVWSGDPGQSITFLINIQSDEDRDTSPYWFLVRSSNLVAAIAIAIGEILPVGDDWSQLDLYCRPLFDYEVDKVSLEDGEIILLDEESHEHLVSIPTPNGEDDDNGEG